MQALSLQAAFAGTAQPVLFIGKEHSGMAVRNAARLFWSHASGYSERCALDEQRGLLALQLLLEGNSVRSAERITGIQRDTIIRLLLEVGERCHLCSSTSTAVCGSPSDVPFGRAAA